MNLDRSISALVAERESLLNQIVAVDRALAILRNTAPASAVAKEREKTAQAAADTTHVASVDAAAITRVRPKKALSETHKAALLEGRRKARLVKEVAAGQAWEPIEAPALAQPLSGEAPRLVKRTTSSSPHNTGRRELTVEPDAEAERTAEIVCA